MGSLIQNLYKLVVVSISSISIVNIPFKMTKNIIFIAFLGLLTLNLTQSFPQNKAGEPLNTGTSDRNVILANEKDKSNNNRPDHFNSFPTAARDEENKQRNLNAGNPTNGKENPAVTEKKVEKPDEEESSTLKTVIIVIV